MIICQLCLTSKSPKKNTHYLTDFIIRGAINETGSNKRGKGLYWEIPYNSIISTFNFQQNTSLKKIESILNRPPNDSEINRAKSQILFSVDDRFCKDCEEVFSKIENDFAHKLLDKFRRNESENDITLTQKESPLFRLFFLMQFWRSSVCTSEYQITPTIKEFIRQKILNDDLNNLENIPLSVTFLQTNSLEENNVPKLVNTENIVATVSDSNPYILIMNDFILQLYDAKPFKYLSFYNINCKKTYKDYLNHHSSTLFLIIESMGYSLKEFMEIYEQVSEDELRLLDEVVDVREYFRG